MRRQGFFLPLLIFGIMAGIFMVVSLLSLGSSYSSQVIHVDEGSRCLMIAEAQLALVVARIREKPYSQRFFAGTPYEELDGSCLGGSFDLFVEDSPAPARDQADIYVRPTFNRARRLFFWRVKHEETLLDAAGRLLPVLFTALDSGRFPTPSSSPFAAEIRDLLAKRRANEGPATAKGAALLPLDLPETLANLKALPAGPAPGLLLPPPGQVPPLPPVSPV